MSDKNGEIARRVFQAFNFAHNCVIECSEQELLEREITQALSKKDRDHEAEIAELKKPTLYDGLCKAIIGRILEADANCEPPHDILLRLETIIRNKEYLQTKIKDHEALIWVLVGALKYVYNNGRGAEVFPATHIIGEQEATEAFIRVYEALSHPLVQEYLKKEKV